MSRLRFRGFTSILLSITFLVVAVTGLVLWLAHSPTTFGISKGVWKHTHIYVSLLMLVTGIVHLCLNWSIYWKYIWEHTARRLNQKWELAAAVALTAVVIAAASQGGPNPMQRLNGMSIQQIAQQAGKPVDQIVAALKKEGIEVHDPAASLLEVSQRNSRSPNVILAVLQREAPQLTAPSRGPH